MDGLNINATAKVKIVKQDNSGNIIGIEEHETTLTEEEAKSLWDLQQQA